MSLNIATADSPDLMITERDFCPMEGALHSTESPAPAASTAARPRWFFP